MERIYLGEENVIENDGYTEWRFSLIGDNYGVCYNDYRNCFNVFHDNYIFDEYKTLKDAKLGLVELIKERNLAYYDKVAEFVA